jgi:hypothetical protein
MTGSEESAFPVFDSDGSTSIGAAGLSKREYFAAMALQGYLAAHASEPTMPVAEIMAKDAVEYADALIKALKDETESA